MARRQKMNAFEATRFAHGFTAALIAEAIRSLPPKEWGTDRALIGRALARIEERHARFGPLAEDRAPALPEEPLPQLPFEPEVEHGLSSDDAPSDAPRLLLADETDVAR